MHLPAAALPGAPSLLLDPVAQAILGQVFGRRAALWNPGDAFVREALANKTIDLASNTLIATSAQLAAAVTDETGTGALVFASSPALAGTPTAPTAAADTNTTQIATTAHVFAERSNAFTLTNKTINLANNTLTATSAQLAAALTDETGSGAAVFATSPTLVTPKATTTFGVGNATPSASGSGVSFPATQSASTDANTLDDYEKGTFTPTIAGTTTAGAGTYSTQVGRYTKIGNRVFYMVHLVWSAHTGTGNMVVAGMPFTSNATASNTNVGSIAASNLTFPGQLAAYMSPSSTQVTLLTFATGAAIAALALDTAATVLVTGSYEV